MSAGGAASGARPAAAPAAGPGPALDGIRAVAAWRDRGLAATALPVDVRDAASVEAAATHVAGTWGAPDLLKNACGAPSWT